MPRFSRKKVFLFGFLAVLLLAIPLTVFVVQKQQETRTRAEAATIVQLCPPTEPNCPPLQPPFGTRTTQTVKKGDEIKVDVKVNPDVNSLTTIRFQITYDPGFLTLKEDGFEANSNSDFVVQPGFPVVDEDQGTVSLAMEINSLKQGLSGVQTLGTFTFIATEATVTEDDPNAPTSVNFERSATNAFSSGGESEAGEDVIANVVGTDVIIEASDDTGSDKTAEGGTSETEEANKPPICESFTADKEASTSAPFLVTYTTEGFDPDGIVAKVTFNFGDGPTQDLTDTGGIGEEASVSAQISHTYQNAGEFTATAAFTDDNDATSDPSNCSQVISVDGEIVASATATPVPTLPPTGPDRTIVGVGILGAILTILGFVVFFAL